MNTQRTAAARLLTGIARLFPGVAVMSLCLGYRQNDYSHANLAADNAAVSLRGMAAIFTARRAHGE